MCLAMVSLGRATAALCDAGWVLFVVYGCRANIYVNYVVEDDVWGSIVCFDFFYNG